MKKLTPKQKALAFLWAIKAFFLNLRVEISERRKQRRKQHWTALRIGGGGVVPLGRITRDQALYKVSKMGGSVRYVDDDYGKIMYADDTL